MRFAFIAGMEPPGAYALTRVLEQNFNDGIAELWGEEPMKRSMDIATAPSRARRMQVLSPIEWGEQQLSHWESLAPATKHWIAIDTILLLGGTIYIWIGA